MNEILAVALVCASTIPAPDCSRATALDVLVAKAHTPFECLMNGQVLATNLGVEPGSERYVKIACETRGRPIRSEASAGEP